MIKKKREILAWKCIKCLIFKFLYDIRTKNVAWNCFHDWILKFLYNVKGKKFQLGRIFNAEQRNVWAQNSGYLGLKGSDKFVRELLSEWCSGTAQEKSYK